MFDLQQYLCNRYPGSTKCVNICDKQKCPANLNTLELFKKLEPVQYREKICAGRPIIKSYFNKSTVEGIQLYSQSQRV